MPAAKSIAKDVEKAVGSILKKYVSKREAMKTPGEQLASELGVKLDAIIQTHAESARRVTDAARERDKKWAAQCKMFQDQASQFKDAMMRADCEIKQMPSIVAQERSLWVAALCAVFEVQPALLFAGGAQTPESILENVKRGTCVGPTANLKISQG